VDQLFHADYGVVLSWRLLEGRGGPLCRPAPHPRCPAASGSEGTASLAPKGASLFADLTSTQQRAHLHKSAVVLTRGEASPPRTPFLLIAVPDATMTLDTLAAALSPLLARHPDGGLLLLGLPGLPSTHWPRSLPLTGEHQARAVAKLLSHLSRPGTPLSPHAHTRGRTPAPRRVGLGRCWCDGVAGCRPHLLRAL
jgi:hypothetical protein